MNPESRPRIDDNELIQSALRGDREALDTLFSKYRSLLHTLAYRVLGKKEEAEDAVQNGLLLAFSKLTELKTKEAFRGWLARIVINEAISMHRTRRIAAKRFQEEAHDESHSDFDRHSSDAPNPEQVLSQKESVLRLKQEMNRLSPALRSTLLLSQIGDYRPEELARILRVQQSTIRCRLFRARKRLADSLELAPRSQR
jgi:RNA polymerase sigma-70 factor (ECF subfamily)